MRHAGDMAIRMKEWGMLSYPRQSVHLPTQGISGWADAGLSLGRGIESVGSAIAGTLADQVKVTGDMAAFAARLEEIGKETAEELAQQPVKDWAYAWNAACAPRLKEAVEELPAHSRAAGRQFAADANMRMLLESQRQHELEKVQNARRQWRLRMEDAVQRGDEQEAAHWLEQGRGVFVPESEVPQEQVRLQSNSSLMRWQHKLQAEPLKALADFRQEEPEMPSLEEDVRTLQQNMELAHRQALLSCSRRVAADILSGKTPQDSWLQEVEQAGIISGDMRKRAAMSPQSAGMEQLCSWTRRVDEAATPEETARIRMEVALAPVPLPERQKLLRRMEVLETNPCEAQRNLSRRLWQLYSGGGMGCPGDAMALKRLSRLQEESLALVQEGDARKLDSWMQQNVRALPLQWICLSA